MRGEDSDAFRARIARMANHLSLGTPQNSAEDFDKRNQEQMIYDFKFFPETPHYFGKPKEKH
jgi:hypothetical protein